MSDPVIITYIICGTVLALAVIIWIASLVCDHRHSQGWKDGYRQARSDMEQIQDGITTKIFLMIKERLGKK